MDKSAEPFISTEAKEDIYFLKDEIKGFLEKNASNIIGPDRAAAKIVQQQIDQYINAIFKLAASNISVNGLPFDDVFQNEDGFEQFDEKLRSDTESAMLQVSACRTRIASLRKSVPESLLQASHEKFRAVMDISFEDHTDPEGDMILESLAGCPNYIGKME
ncbi:hypothetical protein HDU67_001579 [Dinochytrium kinnereticum]|nr:hypothetical protein HDU67_001579 [Dinochytrium kinnereticum]